MSKSTNPYEGLGSTELEGDTYTESFTSEHKVSVLGPTLVFKGELSAGEDLLIQGRVEGKINHNRNLTIGEQGTVKADIRARNITIEGTVQGDLYATESVVVRRRSWQHFLPHSEPRGRRQVQRQRRYGCGRGEGSRLPPTSTSSTTRA